LTDSGASADLTTLAVRARLARVLSVGFYAGLILLMVVESILENSIPVVWVARLLPLLLFVPGVLAGRLRTQIWLCLVCLLYFLTFVQDYFALQYSVWPGLNLLVLFGLFCSGVFYVRWQGKHNRLSADGGSVLSEGLETNPAINVNEREETR
jgi:uncharacterized membrane protein